MGRIGAAELIVILIISAVVVVPSILYVLTLRRALYRCAPESRTMSPDLVWLLFVPVFGIGWHFYMVVMVAKSLHNEFVKRNMAEDVQHGKTLGLATCILFVFGSLPFLRFVNIATLVYWILYWIEIDTSSKKLSTPS